MSQPKPAGVRAPRRERAASSHIVTLLPGGPSQPLLVDLAARVAAATVAAVVVPAAGAGAGAGAGASRGTRACTVISWQRDAVFISEFFRKMKPLRTGLSKKAGPSDQAGLSGQNIC